MFFIRNLRFLLAITFIAFIGGCATSEPDGKNVEGTLQTYKVGVTTFSDFKRDAHLITYEQPAPTPPQLPKSYLNPSPYDSVAYEKLKQRKTAPYYRIAAGSSWKIYKADVTTSLNQDTQSVQVLNIIIGDTNRPISVLNFDEHGILNCISNASGKAEITLPLITYHYTWQFVNYGYRSDQVMNIETNEDFSNSEVGKTLRSYKTGKTTIVDFVRDAHLKNITYPELQEATNSNFTLDATNLSRMVTSSYIVPLAGPWKIYERGIFQNGSYFARVWKFTVGDTNGPMKILSFNKNGVLVNIAPCPRF